MHKHLEMRSILNALHVAFSESQICLTYHIGEGHTMS
jgi:hypothetical protein